MPEEEYPTYDVISEEDKKKFLLEKGYPFFALSAVCLIAALYCLYTGSVVLFCIVAALALAAAVAGISPLYLWNEEQKRNYITSRLYRMSLEYQKQNGITYTPEELDKLRFQNDPLFRQEVINKVHREEDARYKKAVNAANNKVNRLKKEYDKRYKQISDARWEKLYPNVLVNRTEGRLIINGAECEFCDLRGARVENQLGYRVKTHEHKYTEEHTKESKDLSVGGAIAGGLVAGPIGAVAGAFIFSKNKTETVQERKTGYHTENIPVCNHLGVKVYLNGFETEIVLISSQKDQSSFDYTRKLNEANEIAAALHTLAASPMPRNVLLVEQEPEMILLYEDITAAKKYLKQVKDNTPVYRIPERYLPSPEEMCGDEEEEDVIDLTSEDFTVFRSRQAEEEQQTMR